MWFDKLMVDVRVIRQIDAGSSCGSTNSWTMVEVRVVRQIDSGTSYLTSLCSFILHVCMYCICFVFYLYSYRSLAYDVFSFQDQVEVKIKTNTRKYYMKHSK